MICYILVKKLYVLIRTIFMRNQIYPLLFFSTSVLLLNACASVKPIKPAADYSNSKIIYTKELSTIQLPVEISLNEIQTQINKQLTGLLYDDNSLDNNNKV